MKLPQQFKAQLQDFKTDRFVRWSTGISVFFLLIGLLFTGFFWQRLPPVIPFYYSLPWSNSQLGTPVNLFMLLASTLCIFVLNSSFAFIIFSKSKYLAHILLAASPVILVLVVLSISQIMLLVT